MEPTDPIDQAYEGGYADGLADAERTAAKARLTSDELHSVLTDIIDHVETDHIVTAAHAASLVDELHAALAQRGLVLVRQP